VRPHEAFRDRYGFLFWLRWILWFAGSFTAAVLVWTILLQRVFGRIEGPELTLTWIVATFGSWLLIVIPFMRKKEQIWKRLNDDQEIAVDVWFRLMGLFMGLMVVTALGWSQRYRVEIAGEGMQGVWAKAVFGTWMGMAVPFLVVMYRQADRIFTRAVARQTYVPGYRTAAIPLERRLLPDPLAKKLGSYPPVLPNGHVVTALLRDGTRVPHVFILKGREILGVYDRPELGFDASDLADLEPQRPEDLPAYDESKWLRLDVVGT